MNKKKEIFKIVKGAIIKYLFADENEVTLSTDILVDLDPESIDLMELYVRLEEEFDIEIDNKKVAHIVTVEDLVDFIFKELNEEYK